MTLSHFFFTLSLLLFSLLLVVSAGDYGYNTKPYGDNQDSKSETNYRFNLKADLGKSKSENHDYGYKPEAPKPKSEEKPKTESHDYGYKPEALKSKPEGSAYNTKPKSEEKAKSESHDYGYKPEAPKPKPEGSDYNTKPKSEDKPKSEIYDYIPVPIPKPDVYKPKPQDHGSEKPLPISIEGLVLCKSGSKYYPIQGAVAKVTCLVDDIYGSKTTLISFSSKATDSKGYFLTDLCSLKLSDNLKLKKCKVFLDNSPLEDCNLPTDVNRGISGALLNSYRILNEKNIKLYSIGPFFFTSVAKSIPNGY
ncbi:hypothetical protein Ddye_032155 [Dipteronia dyeriana]|uniref:Uncharacterized protein n=1 Tax=Dipteronia dyeriana TaxID=168575 RepID=A0AAD9TK88_9ROSI|nr:hypothetical protein Ddye_032155 [Dipteronia dyeriana]